MPDCGFYIAVRRALTVPCTGVIRSRVRKPGPTYLPCPQAAWSPTFGEVRHPPPPALSCCAMHMPPLSATSCHSTSDAPPPLSATVLCTPLSFSFQSLLCLTCTLEGHGAPTTHGNFASLGENQAYLPPPLLQSPTPCTPPPPQGDRHFHVFLVNIRRAGLCCPLHMALHRFPVASNQSPACVL